MKAWMASRLQEIDVEGWKPGMPSNPTRRARIQAKAKYDPDVPCTSSCKHARGEVCVCSCAGGNHSIFA